MQMRLLFILTAISLFPFTPFSQTIPTAETVFNIHKKEKQPFEFSLQKGYTLKAIVQQIGIDLSISIYKKGDTTRLAYFDSPNGEFGPEPVIFEGPENGNYILFVEPIDEIRCRGNIPSGRFCSDFTSQHTFRKNVFEIVLDHLNSLQIENLTNLGTIWGFLKHHHSSVKTHGYNWMHHYPDHAQNHIAKKK
jgi:hypothetical protein